MGPRKQAKDSRKICERGVPGNFYLAQHSFMFKFIGYSCIQSVYPHNPTYTYSMCTYITLLFDVLKGTMSYMDPNIEYRF